MFFMRHEVGGAEARDKRLKGAALCVGKRAVQLFQSRPQEAGAPTGASCDE